MASVLKMLLILLFAVFTPSRAQKIKFDILEEAPPGFLGNIPVKANLTTFLGQQELNSLQFTIVEDNLGSPLFGVDQTTGDLFTRTTLDREGLCGTAPVCTVGCDVAVQSSSPESAFFRKFSVVVNILDVNDHAPVFSESTFLVDIDESLPVEMAFQLPLATDIDVLSRYKVQRYFLEPQLDEFALSVVKDELPSGELKFTLALRVVKPLDREERELYTLALVAEDGGSPPKRGTLPIAVDILDENDNAPVFDVAKYEKTLTEETPLDSVALKVHAQDADRGDNARVSYFFADSADAMARAIFSVDISTGEIRLRESLDMRGGNTYEFSVMARDNGVPQLSSETSVVINVLDTRNDRPEIHVKPLFSHAGAAVVPESAAIGKVVALLTVTDNDFGRNGIVSCDLDNVHFSLQKLELNEYKIIVAQPLDRERMANHTVVVFCRDSGDPFLSTESLLRVEVRDSNDNSPVFSSSTYYMSVDEGETIGTKVGRVTATDDDFGENARLIYGIQDNGDVFTIDTMLGDIYTTTFLDREAKAQYIFDVYAYDSSPTPLSAVATVIVNIGDKNDMRPVFTNDSYYFFVQERAPVGTVIGQVKATDGDYGLNAKVEYFVVTSKHSPRMPIGVNASGAIVVSGQVDFERAEVYRFTVAAVDMGSPPQNSTADVTVAVVDNNDNSPVITFPGPKNPSVTIPFDTPPRSEIAKVVAYDRDSGPNGKLTYSITIANGSSLFVINRKTGVISLGNHPLPRYFPTHDFLQEIVCRKAPSEWVTGLNRDERSYNVLVAVRDNGVPQRAAQALLRIHVSSSEEEMQHEVNMKIVIGLICITLVLASAVLVTVLIIRCFDRRRRRASEKHKHEIMTKTSSQVEEAGRNCEIMTTTVFTPKRDQPSLYSPKRDFSPQKEQFVLQKEQQASILSVGSKAKSKSVSFQEDTKCVTEEEEGLEKEELRQPVVKVFRETCPFENHFVGNFSTFKPHPRPQAYEERERERQQRVAQASGQGEGGDPAHAQALRQHNALVRSIREARPPPYQQAVAEEGEKDVEVWSSSSADTSDSGHGGSELDYSVVKVTMNASV